MAIGQLADYRRFVDGDPKLAALLPEKPRPDLPALLKSQDIAVIWPRDGGFTDTLDGSMT